VENDLSRRELAVSGFRLSIGIPLHNEEVVLPELLSRTRAVLDGIEGGPHELILVDDGSVDRTAQMLVAAAREDPRIVVVSLSRNFGHQAALSAALDQVTGDAVALLDGDLQDAPEEVPRLLARLREGYDVVYAQRVRRKEPLLLRAAYFLFYRVIASLSRVRLPLDSGDFSVMSRRVVDEIRSIPEHNRYLRGLRSWVGFRQTGLPVERSARAGGESKYSIRGLLRLAWDGIFAFSIAPLRAAALLGVVAIALAGLFTVYAVYSRLVLHRSPQGFTAVIVVMTFLSGVNLFFLGLIGEYVGRVYEEAKARPLYVVERLIRFGRDVRSGADPE
jgi:glycosyltransferase involved in cell wall biosynthesis